MVYVKIELSWICWFITALPCSWHVSEPRKLSYCFHNECDVRALSGVVVLLFALFMFVIWFCLYVSLCVACCVCLLLRFPSVHARTDKLLRYPTACCFVIDSVTGYQEKLDDEFNSGTFCIFSFHSHVIFEMAAIGLNTRGNGDAYR